MRFSFWKPRCSGFKWPGFVNFPELNLRFYVRMGDKRGVCFIREFVPSRLVAGIARTIYNEPYVACPMREDVRVSGDGIRVEYALEGPYDLQIQVEAENAPSTPSENSLEHFFKEHDLGVGRSRSNKTLTYNVWHPRWEVYPVRQASLSLDWGRVYTERFLFLNGQEPSSVCFAKGSEIKVYSADTSAD